MAILEKKLNGDFDSILRHIEDGILNGSISASFESGSDFIGLCSRCSVRVFERYSFMGSNRVSLNVTLFQESQGPIHLSAITAGGSQGTFIKVNTLGEEAFLSKLEELL